MPETRIVTNHRARSSIRFLAIAAVFGLHACQSTQELSAPAGRQSISVQVLEAALLPDSGAFALGTQSGRVAVSPVPPKEVLLEFDIRSPGASDTLDIFLFAKSALVTTRRYLRESDGSWKPLDLLIERDTLVRTLLRRLDSSSLPKTAAGLAHLYAMALLDGDPLTQGFPGRCPLGIDAKAVRDTALGLAAGLGKPLTEIVSGWTLGMDWESARTALLALDPPLSKKDSSILFPPPILRMESPLALSGPTIPGGPAARIQGVAIADSGLASVAFKVFDSSNLDASPWFQIIADQPGDQEKRWDLDALGRSRLQALGAPAGGYRLKLTLVDSRRNRSSFELPFQVEDTTGPAIRLASPSGDTTVDASVDSILVSFSVQSASSVATATVNGAPAKSSANGTWTARIALPQASNPVFVEIADRSGRRNSRSFRVTRRLTAIRFRQTVGVSEPALVPDSSWILVAGTSRRAALALGASEVSVDEPLDRDPGDDTLRWSLFSKSLRFARIDNIRSSDGTWRIVAVRRDTVAAILLRRADGKRFAATPDGVLQAYARALFEGESFAKDFPRSAPAGLDISAVRARVLRTAAASGIPLTEIVKTWNLDLGYDSARAALLELDPRISTADSISLFPSSSISLESPLGLGGALRQKAGSSTAIQGVVLARNGIASIGFEILDSLGNDASTGFVVGMRRLPSLQNAAWDLDIDGQAAMRAATAGPGSYRLRARVKDGADGTASFELRFKVLSAADTSPPALKRVAPAAADTTLDWRTDSVDIVLEASSPIGIDSVLVGTSLAARGLQGTYKARLPAPAEGGSTKIVLAAVDKDGRRRTDTIAVYRRSRTVPSFRVLEPSGGVVAFSAASFRVVLRVRDPMGISDTSVAIQGVRATRLDDSTWSADVASPAPGKRDSVKFSAQNRDGVAGSGAFEARRLADTAGPVVACNLPASDSVPLGTKMFDLECTATDSQAIDRLKVNDKLMTFGGNGHYSFELALGADGTPIVLQAWDAGGNSSRYDWSIHQDCSTDTIKVDESGVTTSFCLPQYGSGNASATWKITDADSIASVTFGGRQIPFKNGAATLDLGTSSASGELVVRSRCGRIWKKKYSFYVKISSTYGC